MNTLNIEILKEFGPNKLGSIVRVQCDANGIPMDSYWRARLRDAKIDNCCAIKEETEAKKAGAKAQRASKSKK